MSDASPRADRSADTQSPGIWVPMNLGPIFPDWRKASMPSAAAEGPLTVPRMRTGSVPYFVDKDRGPARLSSGHRLRNRAIIRHRDGSRQPALSVRPGTGKKQKEHASFGFGVCVQIRGATFFRFLVHPFVFALSVARKKVLMFLKAKTSC